MKTKTVLIVDDSPTEVKLMKQALAGGDYNIVTASDGDEALEKAALCLPAVVLLDVILPRRNGFQVCRQLKTAPETRDARIILVTSKSQDTDRYWGLRQGADDYITKPFSVEALVDSVERHL